MRTVSGMQNPLLNLTVEQLKRAVEIRQQIDALQNELNALLSGKPIRGFSKPAQPAVKGMAKPSALGSSKPRRTLSPEARAKLSAIAKARWRKAKAEGRTRL